MDFSSDERPVEGRRRCYLLLAALILVLAGAVLVGLWQIPRFGPPSTPLPPSVTPTPMPAISHLAITGLSAKADDQAQAVTFTMTAQVPPGRDVVELLLWYDTEAGHEPRRFADPLLADLTFSYRLDVAQEGMAATLPDGELDYWWLIRDTAGETARVGGTVALGPALQALVATPTPQPPPLTFTWGVSATRHYRFYFVPGEAAERDLVQIGAVAEAALDQIRRVLQIEFEGQMSVYLVPRVFWQGGAAYGDKVQLISYLDRNYTGVETWSYFTHEGTHALAQDLIRPKEEEGGPDGVLVEGLAVWASDGHYRREPLDEWAAVVAASDSYIPLAELRAGPFYDFQHETSYLEAGSFVKFLVERYGLDAFKELYGLATNNAAHDEALVRRLYGKSYADLEAEWLAYLTGLSPTPEQAEAWHLEVRAFDLMRRYQTELDPDARILPDKPPPEWRRDDFQIFWQRRDAPLNLVLETALIAAQERLHKGDLAGAAMLLDDVEDSLDAGGSLDRPSLAARQAILELLAAQDRAVIRADARAYRDTLAPAWALAGGSQVTETLSPPFVAYRQELVRLDLADDGLHAHGVVLLHARILGGDWSHDGDLFAVTFTRVGDRWLMAGRQPMEPVLDLLPVLDIGYGWRSAPSLAAGRGWPRPITPQTGPHGNQRGSKSHQQYERHPLRHQRLAMLANRSLTGIPHLFKRKRMDVFKTPSPYTIERDRLMEEESAAYRVGQEISPME